MSDSSNTANTGTGNENPKYDANDAKAWFDSIRQISPYGAEYWSARDLYPLLGYDTWRRFETAIDRAKIACANMG